MAGFSSLRDSALRTLSFDEKKLPDGYASGVNACINAAGRRLPLEFRVLNFAPSPWKIDDVGRLLSVNAWFLETNFREELIWKNEHIAWGATNLMTDCVDPFILRVNPWNPERYLINYRVYETEEEHLRVSITGSKKRNDTIYRTIHGSVITEFEQGIEAVAALKWYGMLEEGALHDTTMHGFLSLMRAKSVHEALEVCRSITTVGQNFVLGDSKGHIIWCATGAVPLRKGYSGRLPEDVLSGEHLGSGFFSPSEMPRSLYPEKGYSATANNRIANKEYLHSISYSWCVPDRCERIVRLLEEFKNPGVEDFRKIQIDNYYIQTERIPSTILNFQYSDPPRS